MGIHWGVFGGVSGFWFVVGFVIPLFIPKGPNKGVTQWCMMLSAVCCWMFWMINYLSQMNPLVGPKLKQLFVFDMAREWGDPALSS